MKVKIDWLSDYFDCETCGGNSAEGARVYFDGVETINLEPSAHCWGGTSYSEEEVFRLIFEKLGHELEVEYE